ncbi:MAG TPA: squalene synthase HpnC, partial [Methylocella sp.]|nr:squalene synthase HpnC [Methylocella sp.]
MTQAFSVAPTKTHRGENFPVASLLIAPRHRPVILAFYRFARAADDIADSPELSPDTKLEGLALFEETLLGKSDAIADALPLRIAIAERKLSPRHALDLLHAFRMDAVKQRYATWAELMEYCSYSAAPVGRFVLDVHGESQSTWPPSDALCTALQIINHLQDCGKDYRSLDRIYIPQETLAAHGAAPGAFGAPQSTPALRAALHDIARQTAPLVAAGARLPHEVRDIRLRLETAVIARLARRLNTLLLARDPLSEPVHLSKPAALAWAGIGAAQGLASLLRQGKAAPPQAR